MKKRAKKGVLRERQARKTLQAILEEEGVRKALWMLNVPTSFAELKGLIAEEKALRAFEYFRRKKVEFYQIGVITNVVPTMHYSWEDKKSIDIKVEFQDGKLIFNEVKSRWSKGIEEKLWRGNRCLIVIPFGISDEEAISVVWKAVSRFLQRSQDKKVDKTQLCGAYH